MEVSGKRETNKKQETKNPKNGGQKNILCQPCQGDGDNILAEGYCETCNEYFCSSCLKFHRKQSATKNHVIKSKDEMPKVQVHRDPCSEPCAIHKAEIVKFYCREHDSVGCGDCMVLHHKSCRVQLVPDVSVNYGNSRELEKIKQKIEELEKEIISSKREIKYNLKAAEETKNKVISEIKTFRKELNSYLDDVEAELLHEIYQLNSTDVTLQRELQAECKSMENELKEFQSKFHQYSDKINQLFVTAKLSKEMIQHCQTSIKDIASQCHIQLCKFEPSNDLVALQTKHVPLGLLTVTQTPNKNVVKLNKKIAQMRAKFVKQVNIRDKNVELDCWITGLAMISSDEILLSNYQNYSLKIFHVGRNAITQEYVAPGRPWDVTLIDSETAATTLPVEGKILFMSTKDGLSESNRLSVRRSCRGIDYRNSILAVSFVGPPAVQTLNRNGNILHEVADTSMLKGPSYISLSNDNKSIFVSDADSSAVYELTIDGRLKNTFKCESMKNPEGLVVTSDGTVVVCEDTSKTVHMIVPDTREILPLSVQGVQKPCSVLVCEEQNKIYISEDIMSSGNNFLKIFELL